MDNPMPPGICRFGYTRYQNGEIIIFSDSCKFYFVGDKVFKQEIENL